MKPAEESIRRRVFVALALVALHAVLSVVLGGILLTTAYRFANTFPGGGQVGSPDELYKLGGGPWFGFLALLLVGVTDFVLTTILLLRTPSTRSKAWIVPVVGMTVSVLVVFVTPLAFNAPAPDIGG